jgi:DNA ligase-1
LSRTGKPFAAPEWFAQLMPANVPLDGELWMGRDKFESCGHIRRKVPDDETWFSVQYLAFDLPAFAEPFEERMAALAGVVAAAVARAPRHIRERHEHLEGMLPEQWRPLEFVRHTKLTGFAHAARLMAESVARKGEGLMLRAPRSMYEQKRSSTLLKLKPVFDAEATIVGYKEGTGKYENLLGSFACELVADPSIQFHLSGMVDEVRRDYEATHPIGTVVTFAYNETTKAGVPRFPRYVRVRPAE